MITVHNISDDPNRFIMQMKEKEEVLGEASAYLTEEGAVLENAECDPAFLLPDLCKALLNALDLAGVQTVKCEREEYRSLLLSLRFREENGAFYANLHNYFTKQC